MTEQAHLDQLCVNTIRTLAMDAVQKANSGHPGMPMGCAPMAYVLWTQFLKHNPQNPNWFDRDRFVLSAGHGSMLLYALLHLTGYDLSMEELKNFRQWGSKTPGHPESHLTPGVETTTGPLGQGFANGVGMAIAERHLAATYNRDGHEVINHYVYSILGDGCLMEGISHEAASLAGHLKLGNLIYLYDDNHITIDGSTDLAFTEDSCKRFEAYGWHVSKVNDGTDLSAIAKAIEEAKAITDKPSLIAIRTEIGHGSPNKQGSASAHGSPLGDEEIRLTKEALGWDYAAFEVPEEALARFRSCLDRGQDMESSWNEKLSQYKQAHPELGAQLESIISGELPADWTDAIPTVAQDDPAIATRQASGNFLQAVAEKLPNLIGGSADLAPSNNTYIKGYEDFQPGRYHGRNFHFGVREHGMGSVLNGMALHGGLIPYGGTFLVFADYNRPSIRLAALMEQRVIFVMTHDSIGLGEDGPTHQPVEHLASLRAIPNLLVLRPGDAAETYAAWQIAIEQRHRPSVLALTRQGLPNLERHGLEALDGSRRGGYVLFDHGGQPDIILMGSGSETHLALNAAKDLAKKGIAARAVSLPCWELFMEQDEDYRESVLPTAVTKRLSIEAGVTQGWSDFVGSKGLSIGINHFGASAPGNTLLQKFGFTAANVMAKAESLLKA